MRDEKDIQKFIEEHTELFRSLSEDILCPSCKEVVKPPFMNLGTKWKWAEGCKECGKKEQQSSGDTDE